MNTQRISEFATYYTDYRRIGDYNHPLRVLARWCDRLQLPTAWRERCAWAYAICDDLPTVLGALNEPFWETLEAGGEPPTRDVLRVFYHVIRSAPKRVRIEQWVALALTEWARANRQPGNQPMKSLAPRQFIEAWAHSRRYLGLPELPHRTLTTSYTQRERDSRALGFILGRPITPAGVQQAAEELGAAIGLPPLVDPEIMTELLSAAGSYFGFKRRADYPGRRLDQLYDTASRYLKKHGEFYCPNGRPGAAEFWAARADVADPHYLYERNPWNRRYWRLYFRDCRKLEPVYRTNNPALMLRNANRYGTT